MDEYKPQAVSTSDLLIEYWMQKMVEEQQKTNALLERLLPKEEAPQKEEIVNEPISNLTSRRKR